MNEPSLATFKTFVKDQRLEFFKLPYEQVYSALVALGYDKKDVMFFRNNASDIVENLRANCWRDFKIAENKYTRSMLQSLIDREEIDKLSPEEAICSYIETNSECMYALLLSNTQSRRARAGKEFEAILELILLGAGILTDSQSSIGKKVFSEKGLGKLVDFVSPGVVQYLINKRDSILISAKTTLKERWQEVPEEMQRTGAKEIFLATLDDSVSDEILETLNEMNIQLVTTKSIKNKKYKDKNMVLTFEKLISICLSVNAEWDEYAYSQSNLHEIEVAINKQIEKHQNHAFAKERYQELLIEIIS